MEFFDKLTKKATETYKEVAEKTNKFAEETKLKKKISDRKSEINKIYEEIGKKVYQKHIADEELNIKSDLAEECQRIDELSDEVEKLHSNIIELSNGKICQNCKQVMEKEAKFCPKCGAEQPEQKVEEAKEVEVVEEKPEEKVDETKNEEN